MTSFDPQVWGPHAWFFINTTVLALPEHVPHDQQRALHGFFDSLQELIPCESCRNHYVDYHNDEALDSSTRASVWAWVTELHNRVNRRAGKPVYTPAHAAAMQKEKFRRKNGLRGMGMGMGIALITTAMVVALLYTASRRSPGS